MKAIVCDADILKTLNPTNVAAYLEAKGWQLQNKIPNKVSVWNKATILGVVVDKLKKINVEVRESDRSLILKAYQERLPIICNGDLIKEGDRFILNNPQKFALDNI